MDEFQISTTEIQSEEDSDWGCKYVSEVGSRS